MCSSVHFTLNLSKLAHSPVLKRLVLGKYFKPAYLFETVGNRLAYKGDIGFNYDPVSHVDLPSVQKLLMDSAKLKLLDDLLK